MCPQLRGVACCLAGAVVLVASARTVAAAGNCDPLLPNPTVVIAAIFDGSVGGCDLNGDGGVSAADITDAIRPGPCPTGGADLLIEIDNQSGTSPVSVFVNGERLAEDCAAGALTTSYSQMLDCPGSGVVSCASFTGLAPGSWHHSLQVLKPNKGQLQDRKSLLVAGSPANGIRYTAFASVFTVTTAKNMGDGSLRQLLQNADGVPKPLLIQFDPAVFPAGVATTIPLDFALPALATDDVTIDGTDSNGEIGNRIIDAGAQPFGALAITGARNHLIGLRLRNAGGNNRDVLNITGTAADGNVVEETIVEQAASADGIGVDSQAGKDFGDTVNVIRDCEISGAADKGVKVTTGAYVRVERCWVHGNSNGGIQATLGGHVEAWSNLVENNFGATAQNGLSANANDDPTMPDTGFSELRTRGNISRGNGANGISIRAFSMADLRDDYLATNGSSGLRIFNDVGPAASAVVQGTSAVCNAVDGAVVANDSTADFGGGSLGSPGNNALAQNNLPAGGSNLRNATTATVSALNNQWEHCGGGPVCNPTPIAAFDLSDHGLNTPFDPAQAHRAQQPVVTSVEETKGKAGELLRIFGSGFNVIDGLFAEDRCADVVGRNTCLPVRGNCVQIGGIAAPVEAVTPTMLVVRWPFTCVAPVPLVVRVDHGPTVATSDPFTVCGNQ